MASPYPTSNINKASSLIFISDTDVACQPVVVAIKQLIHIYASSSFPTGREFVPMFGMWFLVTIGLWQIGSYGRAKKTGVRPRILTT